MGICHASATPFCTNFTAALSSSCWPHNASQIDAARWYLADRGHARDRARQVAHLARHCGYRRVSGLTFTTAQRQYRRHFYRWGAPLHRTRGIRTVATCAASFKRHIRLRCLRPQRCATTTQRCATTTAATTQRRPQRRRSDDSQRRAHAMRARGLRRSTRKTLAVLFKHQRARARRRRTAQLLLAGHAQRSDSFVSMARPRKG